MKVEYVGFIVERKGKIKSMVNNFFDVRILIKISFIIPTKFLKILQPDRFFLCSALSELLNKTAFKIDIHLVNYQIVNLELSNKIETVETKYTFVFCINANMKWITRIW